MTEPIQYAGTLTIRTAPEVMAQVHEAAKMRGTKPSEYVRQALQIALRLDGYDPAYLAPPRDAGALYDSQDGRQRYAAVEAGQIVHMRYHDAKPADQDGRTWLPVVHEDLEPFDPVRHWRLTPFLNVVDRYGTPDRVVATYPVVLKSREHA